MIPDKPVLFQKIITENEGYALKEHAISLLNSGALKPNSAGPNRNFKSFYEEESLSSDHKILYHKVLSALKLQDPVIDPFLGMIISILQPNGFIHNHKDPYFGKFKHLSNKRNVRFNVMIERGSDVSYNPYIEQEPFLVEKCDAWCFNASKLTHGTPPITGPEFRIVYQFGFCLDAI